METRLLVLSQADVRRLLPMGECMTVVAKAHETLARGDAMMPLRTVDRLPGRKGVLALMPSYLGAPPVFGVKVISVFPGNLDTELESHQGGVLLFEVERGVPVALVDAGEITAIRTAAASGVATRLLARDDATTLAILGSGTQAHTHVDAMRLARGVSCLRVWSRSADKAERFARQQGERTGLAIEACATAREAVDGADIICTVTAAREPVLQADWIAPGTHINAVGACVPVRREIDTETMVRSRLFVDLRESCWHEAGDFVMAREEGRIDDNHIVADLGELLLETSPGRTTSDEITLYESLGISTQDLAAAHHVYRKALADGSGQPVTLGGSRHV